jgi:hypothetical protein
VEKINVLDRGRQADPNAPEEEEATDSPEQQPNETPTVDGQPAENAQPEESQPAAENAQQDKPKLKKRIDEDSPFFLE